MCPVLTPAASQSPKAQRTFSGALGEELVHLGDAPRLVEDQDRTLCSGPHADARPGDDAVDQWLYVPS